MQQTKGQVSPYLPLSTLGFKTIQALPFFGERGLQVEAALFVEMLLRRVCVKIMKLHDINSVDRYAIFRVHMEHTSF